MDSILEGNVTNGKIIWSSENQNPKEGSISPMVSVTVNLCHPLLFLEGALPWIDPDWCHSGGGGGQKIHRNQQKSCPSHIYDLACI